MILFDYKLTANGTRNTSASCKKPRCDSNIGKTRSFHTIVLICFIIFGFLKVWKYLISNYQFQKYKLWLTKRKLHYGGKLSC